MCVQVFNLIFHQKIFHFWKKAYNQDTILSDFEGEKIQKMEKGIILALKCFWNFFISKLRKIFFDFFLSKSDNGVFFKPRKCLYAASIDY